MQNTNIESFEMQLQKSANELQFQPSEKVWESIEGSIGGAAGTGIAAGSTKSMLVKSLVGKWILNGLVPFVVIAGGAGLFYVNYSVEDTKSIDNQEETVATNNTTNTFSANKIISSDNVKSSQHDALNTNTVKNKEYTLSEVSSGVLDERKSNSQGNSFKTANNALKNTTSTLDINAVLTGTSNNQPSTIDKKQQMLTSSSSSQTDSDNYNTHTSVFTQADIQKIARKEIEKDNRFDKERNYQSVNFNE